MFLQNCFIWRNTKELRERLEMLGYRMIDNPFCGNLPSITLPFLQTREDGCYFETPWNNGGIDCADNELAFYFLAAMRDDTDKYQLFRGSYGSSRYGQWRICYEDKFRLPVTHPIETIKVGDDAIYFEKASADDIIELFNKKRFHGDSDPVDKLREIVREGRSVTKL